MVLRLVLFVVFYASALAATVAGTNYGMKRLLRGPLRHWWRRRLGERRHRALERSRRFLALGAGDSCFVCLGTVDTDVDVYDPGHGWYHSACFDRLLNDQ